MVDPSLRVGDLIIIEGYHFRITDLILEYNRAPAVYLTSYSEEAINADVPSVSVFQGDGPGPGPEEAGQAAGGDATADEGAGKHAPNIQISSYDRKCGIPACTLCYPKNRMAEAPGIPDVEGPRESPTAVPGGDLH